MNPILQVKLRFSNEKNTSKPSGRKLRSTDETTVEKIDALIADLRTVIRFYKDSNRYIKDILIDANYNDIIAKSNRIQDLLKPSRKSTNDAVVGARFSDAENGEENHIITYYVDENTVLQTISELHIIRRFLRDRLGGIASPENFNEIKNDAIYSGYGLSKSKIRGLIIDCSVVDSFTVPYVAETTYSDNMLITFYKTELSLSSLLEKLDVDSIRYRYTSYGNDTISVARDLFLILKEKVPYMISMISTDLSRIGINDITPQSNIPEVQIDSPQNEPIVGVIDTLFDSNVYFSEWVENIDYLDDIEKMSLHNYPREHGTEVTSIIVDGPRLNPILEDGCGRFRVKHYGVCESKISTSRLVKKIKEIVNLNPEIHVWNLSLGTDDEVSKNFISFDASVLDDIQSQKNIVFIISGTNDNRVEKDSVLRVGSPADSLNSLVVNSVRLDGTSTSYSRKGQILSFYNKPDLSYYGGDYDERITAFSPSAGNESVYGTSFAAPWISRKMCYLIDVMGLPREVAKALIIDSAAGWEYKNNTYSQKDIIGYGVPPIDIRDVLSTASDEIKFYIYGTSESYKTTNYGIPIPRDADDKYPYIARATLCYFPKCSRSQGVDYTNRELSLKFGRINGKGIIEDINDNVQDDNYAHIDERRSRADFRKWENTKFISKVFKPNRRPLKSYGDRLWGISIISKERLSSHMGEALKFGAVITLKEINGINRIQDFIRACTLRGWIVNEINIQNRLDVYNTTQEEINFD